jgi:hypothetical protein
LAENKKLGFLHKIYGSLVRVEALRFKAAAIAAALKPNSN